jgi:DNA-binding XRE family transcriptional regulator
MPEIPFVPTLTQPQIIPDSEGNPLYAVIPYSDYEVLMADDDAVALPHDVAMNIAIKEMTPLKSWRKYRQFSQADMAEKLKVTQGAVAQTEKAGNKPQLATLKAWAAILECDVNQLTE